MKIIITESQLYRILKEGKINPSPEPAKLDDDKNTLKYNMSGEKVGQLQKCINLTDSSGNTLITKYFGDKTNTKLKSLYPEYNPETGIGLTLYNKIISNCNKVSTSTTTKQVKTEKYNPSAFNSNAQEITKILKEKGIPEASIAAILANLYAESRFIASAKGDIRIKGGPSVGIAQWRETRKKALIDWSKDKSQGNCDPNTVTCQVNFLLYEMEKTFPVVYGKVRNPISVSDTTKYITTHYEIPQNKEKQAEIRAGFANQIIDAHPDLFPTLNKK
jgi:hypothetical protein